MVNWYLLRERKKRQNTCHLAAIRLQPFPMVSPEETGYENTGYWSQVRIKGMISVSPLNTDFNILPYIEKH